MQRRWHTRIIAQIHARVSDQGHGAINGMNNLRVVAQPAFGDCGFVVLWWLYTRVCGPTTREGLAMSQSIQTKYFPRNPTRNLAAAIACALAGLAGAAPASVQADELAQIIVRPGLNFFETRFLLPDSANLPPFAAFQAEIANAGPATSSGLLFYQTQGLTWSCQATSCGAQGSFELFSLGTCVELARQVGPVVRFSASGHDAFATEIETCNGAASGAAVQPPNVIAPPVGRIAPPGG